MAPLRILLTKLGGLFRKRRLEQQLDEDVRAHLEMLIEENVRSGMDPEEARYAALRQFGNVSSMKEECREHWSIRIIEELVQDVRYGLRQLRRNPGFTIVTILTLALGIGANTTIFSAVNAELLHPFLFKDQDQIAKVWETAPKQNVDRSAVAPANFLDWSKQNKTLDLLAADHHWNVDLTGRGLAERVEGCQVTANFFRLLGVEPLFGRFTNATDYHPEQQNVVVFSYGFWQRHLGMDRSIVGKAVLLNNQKFTVIGIMPKGFDYPLGAEAWSPLDLTGTAGADRANHYLEVIGRLKPGISVGQAQADLEGIAERLGQVYPQTNSGHGVRVAGLVRYVTGDARPFLLLLLVAAAFVLLLACANVVNLQLARATGRQKEIAVRLALGAGRWRLIRQLLAETLVMAVLGGLAGALFASWGLRLLMRSIPPFIVQHVAGLAHLRVDSTVLFFTLGVALVAGILAGLVPALRVSHPDLNRTLKEGGRGGSSAPAHQRIRSVLVLAEIALAVVLLVGAGLMVKGFRHLINSDLGFDRRNVLTFSIALPPSKYQSNTSIRNFYRSVIQGLEGLPGVESAGTVTTLPATGGWNKTQYRAEGQPPTTPGELRLTVWQSVTPGFFRALHVPLIQGRFLASQDGADTQPVAVISRSIARLTYPGQNPVGKQIKLGGERNDEPWRTIVGVVGDVKQSSLDPAVHPTTYVPFSQTPLAGSSVVLRTSGDPLALASAARRQVESVDPNVPASDVRTLEQVVSGETSGVGSAARTMAAFGLIALVLAAAGIFALMAYSITQRTHEIGVRMALGARRADILSLVIRRGMMLAAAGIGTGIAAALILTRFLSGILYGVKPTDPVTFISVSLILIGVALLACYIPARRASKVDPMVALRYE
jgi:predicted permease